MTQLRAMQLLAQRTGAPPRFVQQRLGRVQLGRRGGDGALRISEPSVGVGLQLLFGVQRRAPVVKLLRQLLIGIRQRGELVGERLHAGGGGRIFFDQPLLAVDGDREARLRLRLRDLPRGARFTCLFLLAFGGAHLGARFRNLRVRFTGARAHGGRLIGQLSRARIQLTQPCRKLLGQRDGLLHFAVGAFATTFHFALHFIRATRFLLRAIGRFDGRRLRTFCFAQCETRGVSRHRRRIAGRISGREIGFESRQLGATLQRAGARHGARQKHGAAIIDERLTTIDRPNLTKQRTDPAQCGTARLHTRGQRIVIGAHLGDDIQRQQEQWPGLRLRMPPAHRARRVRIANDDRVHRGAEVALHQLGRFAIGGDEVGERAQHGTRAKPLALAQQLGRRRCESYTLALERLQRIATSFQCGPCPHGGGEGAARLCVGGACGDRGQTRAFQRHLRVTRVASGQDDLLGGRNEFTLGRGQYIGQPFALDFQRLLALFGFCVLASRALAIEIEATRLIAMLAHLTLELIEHGAGALHGFTRGLLNGDAFGQRLAGLGQLTLKRGAIGGGAITILAQTTAKRLVLAPLFFRALAPLHRAALPLFGHGQFALELLRLVALFHGQARQLHTTPFGRGARAVGDFACGLGTLNRVVRIRNARLEFDQAFVQRGQFVAPRRHLAGGQRQLHLKAAGDEFRMAFGTPTLTGERTDLALDFGDEVVEARQVDRCLIETALGAAPAIAIQADARRLLKQFASIVGTVREQRIDHAALDHDARIGTESGAAHEILNVAQATRRAVEQVLALTRTQQATRQHHFLERHRQFAVVVLEVQRHFRHVHGLACGRPVEDHVFHLRAAHRPRPLFTQHPAHGVRDVGLSAPIGTDDSSHAAFKQELGVIGKCLEPMDFELRQPH